MFMIAIGVCAAIIIFCAWLFWAEVGNATDDESIRALIDDANHAEHSLVVVCSKCLCVSTGPSAPRVQEFVRILREKHKTGFCLELWIKSRVSAELQQLAQEGVIRIFHLPKSFRFEGRIVDGRIVHRYFGVDRDLYGPGNYARGDAPDEAADILESLHCIAEDNPTDPAMPATAHAFACQP
jgi:hypothetical protein